MHEIFSFSMTRILSDTRSLTQVSHAPHVLETLSILPTSDIQKPLTHSLLTHPLNTHSFAHWMSEYITMNTIVPSLGIFFLWYLKHDDKKKFDHENHAQGQFFNYIFYSLHFSGVTSATFVITKTYILFY